MVWQVAEIESVIAELRQRGVVVEEYESGWAPKR
jgi:hypothetical protein